jgi:hypothetical protein
MANQQKHELEPRWCFEEHILKGFVVIHKDSRANIDHLKYAKIHYLDKNKKIYCRIFGPGTPKGNSKYYDKYKEDIVKKSIFMDSYYKEQLGLRNEDMENKKTFIITEIGKIKYFILGALNHPDDGIRISA